MSIPRNLGNFADNVNSSGLLNVTGINATGTPSSTTVLAGNGSWVTPSAGAVVFISSATASASASISFTGLTTTYAYYFVEYDSVYGSSAGSSLYFSVSSDNGASYIGSGQYKFSNLQFDTVYSAPTVFKDSTGNEFGIGGLGYGISNTATQPSSGIIKIIAPASTSCSFTWQTMSRNAAILESFVGAGGMVTAVSINAIKIQANVNITGNFRLYGVVKT